MSCKRVVVVLLDNLFSQLWVGQNVEECFPVDQVIFLVLGRIFEFESFYDKLFSMELVFVTIDSIISNCFSDVA